MKFTNTYQLPEAVFKAVTSSDYDPGKSTYSATTLLKPPQMQQLIRKHWDEIEEDAMDRVWSLLGQAAHHILERHGSDDSITEERLYVDILGEKIGGQVDHYQDGVITDYKVTSVWSIIYGSRVKEWEEQLNIYAYLFQKNNHNVNGLQIVTILRDWQESKAHEENYPKSPIVVLDINLWTEAKQEAFLTERVSLHQYASIVEAMPECTPEEMWQKETKYAVKKEGGKRALRVCDSEKDAAKWCEDNGYLLGMDALLEVREGERTRCERFCPVKKWCQQYQNYKRNS